VLHDCSATILRVPCRWTDDEKLKIVQETMQTTRAISSTARRYGISRSLLLNWRRSFCTEPEGAAGQRSGFVPAMVVAEPSAGEEFRLGALELRIDSNYSDSKK
jgi:transposase-like protein